MPGKAIHGLEGTPEYRSWSAMKSRCQRQKDPAYKNYGARGITVCDRWLKFENFIADMGSKPDRKMTLERLENHKGYSADNCVWATYTEQGRNKRLSSRNSSGFTGVARDKNSWTAYIKIGGKKVHLGNFLAKQDAVEARRRAAKAAGFKTDFAIG